MTTGWWVVALFTAWGVGFLMAAVACTAGLRKRDAVPEPVRDQAAPRTILTGGAGVASAQHRADRAFVHAEAAFAIFLALMAGAGAWVWGLAPAWLFGVGAGAGFWISGERRRSLRVRAGARRDLLRDLVPGSVILTHERGCVAVPCTCSPTVHLAPRAGSPS